jgi:vesicle-associated membrane protein 7
MSIIYGLIAKDTKPLCDYSEYKGTFSSVCIKALSKCSEMKGVLTIENYNLYYKKDAKLTFMLMCEKGYSEEGALQCIDSIIKQFQSQITSLNYDNEPIYSLNSTFQQKLRMLIEKYNDPKNVKNVVSQLTNDLLDMHRQVINTADIVNERGDSINMIVTKSEQLSRDSYTFQQTAKRVKYYEKCKKIKLYAVIAAIVILIIGGYILLKRK